MKICTGKMRIELSLSLVEQFGNDKVIQNRLITLIKFGFLL